MNRARRESLAAIMTSLRDAEGIITDARDALEVIKEEEEEYRDNMPESLQGGEKYDKAEEAIGHLEQALEMLGDMSFDDIATEIDGASA